MAEEGEVRPYGPQVGVEAGVGGHRRAPLPAAVGVEEGACLTAEAAMMLWSVPVGVEVVGEVA